MQLHRRRPSLIFHLYLSQSCPRIRVYPREAVVAEKFEAMVQLGMTNSRMKDYYDLWFLSRHFEFEGSTFAAAVTATFNRRGTVIPPESPFVTDYICQRNCLRPPSRVPDSAIGMCTLRGLDVNKSFA